MTNGPKNIGYNHQVSKNLILIIRQIKWAETHNFQKYQSRLLILHRLGEAAGDGGGGGNYQNSIPELGHFTKQKN